MDEAAPVGFAAVTRWVHRQERQAQCNPTSIAWRRVGRGKRLTFGLEGAREPIVRVLMSPLSAPDGGMVYLRSFRQFNPFPERGTAAMGLPLGEE